MTTPLAPAPRATLSERLGFRPAVLEIGSTHPAVRRVLAGSGSSAAFLVALDDDRIESLEVEIGQTHRGFEREVESRPWHEALPYVARLGYAAGPIAQLAYCLGIERLMGVEVAAAVRWHRTLVCELARATDHLARVAALATAIGASAAERVAAQAERIASEWLGLAVGGGPLEVWTRPGAGASRAAAFVRASEQRWATARGRLDGAIDRLAALLLDHPISAARLCDVAPLTPEVASAFAVTGPCLRASGVARDLRLETPQLAYDELDFDLAIGSRGDDFDRLAVVLEELRQSLSMIEQCGARLRDSSAEPPAVAQAAEAEADRAPGEPLDVPAGEVEIALESSTGELGFLIVSDGGPRPRRVRCRAPSFFHAQALPAVLIGARLDDLLPTVALFHLVGPEHDR